MDVKQTPIDGLFVVSTKSICDERGAFARYFCIDELASVLGNRTIQQVNYSCTNLVGAIRGLHFQYAPNAEMKFVRCTKGRVFDVALDLRFGSPTFLSWHAELLSPATRTMMVIPEGCAHGFQVLEPESELLYLHTAVYNKNVEGAVRYNDPMHSINWPLPITEISQRDKNHPLLTLDFKGIRTNEVA